MVIFIIWVILIPSSCEERTRLEGTFDSAIYYCNQRNMTLYPSDRLETLSFKQQLIYGDVCAGTWFNKFATRRYRFDYFQIITERRKEAHSTPSLCSIIYSKRDLIFSWLENIIARYRRCMSYSLSLSDLHSATSQNHAYIYGGFIPTGLERMCGFIYSGGTIYLPCNQSMPYTCFETSSSELVQTISKVPDALVIQSNASCDDMLDNSETPTKGNNQTTSLITDMNDTIEDISQEDKTQVDWLHGVIIPVVSVVSGATLTSLVVVFACCRFHKRKCVQENMYLHVEMTQGNQCQEYADLTIGKHDNDGEVNSGNVYYNSCSGRSACGNDETRKRNEKTHLMNTDKKNQEVQNIYDDVED